MKKEILMRADHLREILDFLYSHTDEGPFGEGWHSVDLDRVIAELEERLEVPEHERWGAIDGPPLVLMT